MKISQATVAILLSDEGQQVLQLAIPELAESPVASLYVQETDDLGLWIRIRRADGNHMLLVRWEYVLTVDIPEQQLRKIGLGV